MPFIRIGHFDDFKGSKTLPIECDDEGLRTLIELIRDVATSGEPSILERHPDVIACGAVGISLERSVDDVGLIAGSDRNFVWRRSSQAWATIVAKLLAMQGVGPAHQYLDGSADILQVIVAIGEYGEPWWSSHTA